MLENSYDIPGIHFGIIISKKFDELHNKSDERRINVVDSAIADKDVRFISLDQISGLQAKEIINIVNQIIDIDCNCIIFSVYYYVEFPNLIVESSCEKTSSGLRSIDLNLDIDVTTTAHNYILISTTIYNIEESAKDKEFDDIVVETINSNYLKESDENKRWMRCFLQRHKYGSNDRVDEELSQKILQKQIDTINDL